MPLTAERLKDILENPTSFFQLFLIKALERILEGDVGPGTTDEILDEMLPATINSQLVMFGHKLGDYMGLDRTTIKAKFKKPDGSALSDANVDAIFAAAGIITGTSAPNPMSGPASEAPPLQPQPAKREVAKPVVEKKKDETKKSS